jgi:hypothetical protein
VPFTFTLADDRRLTVIHNEFLMLFPSGRFAMVGHADESFTLVDLANVTAVDVDPRYATRRQKSAPKKKRRSN